MTIDQSQFAINALNHEGNSTYPIPTVVPTGVVNDTKCEMSLPSVLVTFE